MPTSTTATSTSTRENQVSAATVIISKYVSAASGSTSSTPAERTQARRCSSSARSSASRSPSAISSPSTTMRSLTRCRCGDTYSPTRSPCARSIAATMRVTLPLPFVPATCTTA
jgi:hypothetical protein